MNDEMMKGDRTPVDRLVDIADAMFDKALKLDTMRQSTKTEEMPETLAGLRDEIFLAVVATWRVIELMLPSSGLEYSKRKQLEVDGYKVISRCYQNLGDVQKATQAIIKAIDLGYAEGYVSLGAICLEQEDYEGAEKAFHSAIAKGAETMRAHAGLGELYFALGTQSLKTNDGKHVEYFEKAEEAFWAAGRERFAEGYERAMELFETIGWKDRALRFGEQANRFYETNRLKYGDRLRALDTRMRKIAGDERYDRFLAGVSRTLGNFVGGKKPQKDVE